MPSKMSRDLSREASFVFLCSLVGTAAVLLNHAWRRPCPCCGRRLDPRQVELRIYRTGGIIRIHGIHLNPLACGFLRVPSGVIGCAIVLLRIVAPTLLTRVWTVEGPPFKACPCVYAQDVGVPRSSGRTASLLHPMSPHTWPVPSLHVALVPPSSSGPGVPPCPFLSDGVATFVFLSPGPSPPFNRTTSTEETDGLIGSTTGFDSVRGLSQEGPRRGLNQAFRTRFEAEAHVHLRTCEAEAR